MTSFACTTTAPRQRSNHSQTPKRPATLRACTSPGTSSPESKLQPTRSSTRKSPTTPNIQANLRQCQHRRLTSRQTSPWTVAPSSNRGIPLRYTSRYQRGKPIPRAALPRHAASPHCWQTLPLALRTTRYQRPLTSSWTTTESTPRPPPIDKSEADESTRAAHTRATNLRPLDALPMPATSTH